MELLSGYNNFEDHKPVLFMDNARIHHSKEFIVKNFENKIRILYKAPYSPNLNPIENFFSLLISKYK